jgi:hypothetical protein
VAFTRQIVITDSSNVSALKYDIQKRVLHVIFLDGSKYAYLDVPRSIFGDLCAADSVGIYLNAVVKPNYPAIQLKKNLLTDDISRSTLRM